MKKQIITLMLISLVGLGCVSGGPGGAGEAQSADVTVVDANRVGNRQYELIEIFEDNEVITGDYSDAIAKAHLTDRMAKQASKVGADGLIISCKSGRGSLVCRGLAVRWLGTNKQPSAATETSHNE